MNKIEEFYSQNFDPIKRKKKDIKYLVFHYTGMKTEKSALKRLCNNKSKVSCHYFIKNNGWMDSKTNGKMRLEGKDYIVKDGDVLNFRFNT